MKIITKKYFLNNIGSSKLIKKYISGISDKILNNGGINWESICFFELKNNKMFFLDYNLDAIFIPEIYEITEKEILSDIEITLDDWSLIHISEIASHNKNNLHKSLDWSCQYSINDDKALFEKISNLKNGTWKLENNRINISILFSLSTEILFNSEVYLYIGIDDISNYPFKIEEVRNKIHFIKQLIEWMI